MKTIYTLLLLALLYRPSASAQVWAPNTGTYWYYKYPVQLGCSEGYAKYDYYKDTLVNGNTCQMIRRFRSIVCSNGPHVGYYAPVYTYTNTNKVVYVNDFGDGFTTAGNLQTQVFDTLFWFDAPIGAKWEMTHQNYNCTFTTTCLVTVLDTNHTTFQGINLRWQKVSYNIRQGSQETTITDTIYERFGYLRTDPFNPHNFCSNIADAQSYRIFRCYGDNQLTNFKYRYTGACDFYETSIDEQGMSDGISVFPNPAGSQLFIRYTNPAWKEASIDIRDVLGRAVLSQAMATGIYIGSLAPGIYFVTVKNDSGLKTVKILKE